MTCSYFKNLQSVQDQLQLCSIQQKRSARKILDAQEYNECTPLFLLPPEDFDYVMEQLMGQTRPMNPCIKDCLALNATCKTLNNIPYLGKLPQHHPDHEKNNNMKQLLLKINDSNYWQHRKALLLLTYAGAKHDAMTNIPLLKRAVHLGDIEMIKVLFEHGVNPNYKNSRGDYAAFHIKTPEIAQLFFDNDLDLHASTPWTPNILHNCLT